MTPETISIFPQRRDWLLLAVGLLAIFVFCLGSRGLNEPDEGRYANIARAMVLSGDWWEPRMSGFGHYDKPPLVYWVTALSLRTFGMNEWAARVPPLLGAVFALAGLAWAGSRLYGPRVAWWAVLICGTCAQFYIIGRLLTPDMLLTGWCSLAIAAWVECRHRSGAWRWWLASLCFWTLAWWTKATPALIPLAGILVGVLVRRDVAGRKALRIWLLFPAILALGAAWFLSMMSRYPELQHFFFGRELAGRMAGRVDGRHGSKIYYLPISAVGWLPWWPLAVWSGWKNRGRFAPSTGTSTIETWCLRLGVEGWIVVTGLVIFSLAASKLPTYTLTLAPWAALGMARLVVLLSASEASIPFYRRLPVLAASGFIVVVIAGALLMPRYETKLGVNSSLRTVCDFLRRQGATRVDADQYWPSMEFYLGDAVVHYVVNNDRQQERSTDPGLPPNRFIDPENWPSLKEIAGKSGPSASGLWLVRFSKRKNSPFDSVFAGNQEKRLSKMIGQFELIHARIGADNQIIAIPVSP